MHIIGNSTELYQKKECELSILEIYYSIHGDQDSDYTFEGFLTLIPPALPRKIALPFLYSAPPQKNESRKIYLTQKLKYEGYLTEERANAYFVQKITKHYITHV